MEKLSKQTSHLLLSSASSGCCTAASSDSSCSHCDTHDVSKGLTVPSVPSATSSGVSGGILASTMSIQRGTHFAYQATCRAVLDGKKKVFRHQFSKKSPRALHVLNHGWQRLAVGGPLGRSLRAVLSKKKKNLVLQGPPCPVVRSLLLSKVLQGCFVECLRWYGDLGPRIH